MSYGRDDGGGEYGRGRAHDNRQPSHPLKSYQYPSSLYAQSQDRAHVHKSGHHLTAPETSAHHYHHGSSMVDAHSQPGHGLSPGSGGVAAPYGQSQSYVTPGISARTGGAHFHQGRSMSQGTGTTDLPSLSNHRRDASPAALRRAGNSEYGQAGRRDGTMAAAAEGGEQPRREGRRPLPELPVDKKVRRKSSLRKRPEQPTTDRLHKPSVRFSERETILSSATHIGLPSTAEGNEGEPSGLAAAATQQRRVSPLKASHDVKSHVKPGSRLANGLSAPVPPEPSPLLPPSLLSKAEPASYSRTSYDYESGTAVSAAAAAAFSAAATVDGQRAGGGGMGDTLFRSTRQNTGGAVQPGLRQQQQQHGAPGYAAPTVASSRNSRASNMKIEPLQPPKLSYRSAAVERSSAAETITIDDLAKKMAAADMQSLPSLTRTGNEAYQRTTTPRANLTSNVTSSDCRVGLTNLGNTCYMNSVVQCLSHTRPLKMLILSRNFLPERSSVCRISTEFSKVVIQLWSDGMRAVAPSALRSQIVTVTQQFKGNEQHDANEFLRALMNGIHQELNCGSGGSMRLDSARLARLSAEAQASEVWRACLECNNSVITEVFGGQMCSTLTCRSCKSRSYTFEPFWDLQLPIAKEPVPTATPGSHSTPSRRYSSSFDNLGMSADEFQKQAMARAGAAVSIYDCLSLFTQEELLDGTNRPLCEKCRVHCDFTKQLAIQRLPTVLILHLKRFEASRQHRQKIHKVVRFEEELDVGFCSRGEGGGPAKYQLYAVCNHSGTVSSGHYRAACRNLDADDRRVPCRWRDFDDSTVREMNRAFCTKEAYMLFYERVG